MKVHSYDTPQAAILSLEKAYSEEDLEKVIMSKDFVTEAILILERKSFEINPEIVNEVAQFLELSLIKSLQENGYPNFNEAKREFSELNSFRDNIYFLEERIFYPDNTCHINKVFLTKNNDLWKVAMVEE